MTINPFVEGQGWKMLIGLKIVDVYNKEHDDKMDYPVIEFDNGLRIRVYPTRDDSAAFVIEQEGVHK